MRSRSSGKPVPIIDWPIYVINLDRAADRLAALTQRMNRAGLAFRRVPAVDGKELTEAEIAKAVAPDQIRRFKRALSRSEIACYMSHIATWRLTASGDAPAAFVFEDDVDFLDDAPALLEAITGRPLDWDILRLFADRPVVLRDSAALIGSYQYGLPRPQPLTCIAYAITRPAAGELAKRAIPFARPIDIDFRHWWHFNACVKQVDPSPFWPAEHHLSTSEIATGRIEHRQGSRWLRFWRNLRYQSRYGFGRLFYQNRVRRRPAWPQACDRHVA
jgi:glycosyl transferase family 25